MRSFCLKLIAAAWAAAALAGCAGNPLRSYNSEMTASMASVKVGKVDEALAGLERNAGAEKDLLYFLEKGELLRAGEKYEKSRDAWLNADEKIRQWEEEAKLNPQKLLGNIGSVMVNDKTRRYDGQDYEKVMLSVRLALDHAALGEWDKARLEIKKMHEREAIIAELRSMEMEEIRRKAEARNVSAVSVRDLKGYPVETLHDPAVIRLQNAYQSAIGHYLAGFIYEALGEGSLAAAGYRKAIELQPDIEPLEDSLANLDDRLKTPHPGLTDVLFIVETGNVPALGSVNVPLPVNLGGRAGWAIVPTSFPVIAPQRLPFMPSVRVDGKDLPLAPITNLDAMARRSLADAMPGIVLRSALRAIAKGAAQRAASNRNDLAGFFQQVANIVTESADDRMWRSLPGLVSIHRVTLPYGVHRIDLPQFGGREVDLTGKQAIVTLTVSGHAVYGSLAQTSPEMVVAQAEMAALAAAGEPSAAKEASPRKAAKALPRKANPGKIQSPTSAATKDNRL